MNFTSRSYKILFALLGAILLFNLFFGLNNVPLESYDESRHGVNAVEALESGNYLLNTWNGQPDYFNLKPVLSYWPQMLGFKIFGLNPFGLRFFSGVEMFICFGLLTWFCYKQKGLPFALLTAALLVSSPRLITRHGGRSGDADALFICLYVLALIFILWDNKSYFKYCVASFVAGLAFLTKSFHIMPLGLTVIIFYLMDFKLSRKAALNGMLCVLCFLGPVLAWAALRYQYDGTAFFEQMLFKDVFQRVSEEMEGLKRGYYFYFIKVLQAFPLWLGGLLFMFIAFIRLNSISLKKGGKKQSIFSYLAIKDKFLQRLLIIVLVPFVAYTISTSKLEWYIYPSYPFLAMLLAAGFLYYGPLILKFCPAWKISLSALLLICFLGSQGIVFANLHGMLNREDAGQDAVMEMAARKKPAQVAYLFVDGKRTEWRQSPILRAKMYDNIVLMPGGNSAYQACLPQGQQEQQDHQGQQGHQDYQGQQGQQDHQGQQELAALKSLHYEW